MSRKMREAQAISMGTFDGGTLTADILLDVCAPSEGALIDSITYTSKVVGEGTGTYTFVVEEAGTSIALTAALAGVDADATVQTIHGTAAGNGVGATALGTNLQIQVVEAGAVTLGEKVAFVIRWLT